MANLHYQLPEDNYNDDSIGMSLYIGNRRAGKPNQKGNHSVTRLENDREKE